MVVLGSHAVVHPGAVMVEALHTLIADAAVPRAVSADDLTVGTQQHWVEVFKHVEERYLLMAGEVARVLECTHAEEDEGQSEEYGIHCEPGLAIPIEIGHYS